MPLTAAGKLKIVALSDLGGLGAKEGAPVEYEWVMPNPAPVLIPWLAILGLLVLKPNRSASAWLVLIPLAVVLVVSSMVSPLMPSPAGFLVDAIAALAFGLSAVWLMPGFVRQSHRFLTFLAVLLVAAGFSAVAYFSRLDWGGSSPEGFAFAIMLAMGVLISAASVIMAGLICRSRYRPLGLYLWAYAMMVVAWFVIATPFFLIALASSGGRLNWTELFLPVLAVASANFAILLPFLFLSSASPFYRERLKALLHVKPEPPPVMPDASLNTAV